MDKGNNRKDMITPLIVLKNYFKPFIIKVRNRRKDEEKKEKKQIFINTLTG